MNTMKPSQLEEALMVCIDAGRPAYIEGAPGLGKTSIVAGIARKLDCRLVDPSALTLESVDLRGIPWVEQQLHRSRPDNPTHVTRWAIPEFLHQDSSDPRRTLLFFDDLPAAPVSVQVALFQLILEKRVGPHKVKADTIIIGAGNGASHGAGANKILSPIRTRLVQFNLGPNLDDWEKWALSEGNIHPTIPAFLRWRPDLLHAHDNNSQAFPCPRTWEFASQLIQTARERQCDQMTVHSLIEGVVGSGAAIEYSAFLKTWQGLPKLEDILEGKGKKIKLDDPATKYAVTYALAARSTAENYEAVLGWMEAQMPPEYLIMLVKAAHTRDEKLKEHPAWAGTKGPDGKIKKGMEGAAVRLAPKLI